jgi:AcrR family transcriptional regulator
MTKSDVEARESIRKAARTEFAERGFQGARMAKIAESAGVNKALIHYYFTNKEGLYEDVLDRMFNNPDVNINFPMLRGNIDLTAPQRLYLLTYFIVMAHLRCTDMEENSILLWEIAEGGDFLGKVYSKYIAELSEKVIKFFNDGIESGEFHSKYPGLIMMGFKNMIDSFVHEAGRRFRHTPFEKSVGLLTEDDYLEFFIDYMFHMLGPDDRKLQVPEIPEDIITYIDQLLEIIKESKMTKDFNVKIFDFILGI